MKKNLFAAILVGALSPVVLAGDRLSPVHQLYVGSQRELQELVCPGTTGHHADSQEPRYRYSESTHHPIPFLLIRLRLARPHPEAHAARFRS